MLIYLINKAFTTNCSSKLVLFQFYKHAWKGIYIYGSSSTRVNPCADPCAAELFVSILHRFGAGIANTIFSTKWMKNNCHLSKIAISQIEYLINWPSTVIYVTNFSGILFILKLAWNHIYTVLAAQGLRHLNIMCLDLLKSLSWRYTDLGHGGHHISKHSLFHISASL